MQMHEYVHANPTLHELHAHVYIHYVTLRYVALYCITSHYITLHTYMYIIYTYIAHRKHACNMYNIYINTLYNIIYIYVRVRGTHVISYYDKH